MAVAAGMKLGKYRLVSLLGTGGMAEVWKAKMAGPGGFERTVVVKCILPHCARDQDLMQMFLDEARLCALIHHPNVVQVTELGTERGEYFMAMEYVDGVDLLEVIRAAARRGTPVPVGLCALVVRDIARALGHAHELRGEDGTPLRIVHRDVSPSNIMLGREGMVKLCDFGIAKALGQSSDVRTRSGTLKGKFSYMAPEQVDGLPIDHRADLFAAAIVLHEALTGRRLFKADTDVGTLALVRAAQVAPPSTMRPDVPPGLDEVCLRALARDRDARYATGQAFAEALDPYVGDWDAAELRHYLEALDVQRRAVPVPATVTDAPEAVSSFDPTTVDVPSPRGRGRLLATGGALLALAGILVVARVAARPNAPPPSTPAPSVAIAAPAPVVPASPPTSPSVVPASPPTPPVAVLPTRPKPGPTKRARPTRAPPKAAAPVPRDTFDPDSPLPR